MFQLCSAENWARGYGYGEQQVVLLKCGALWCYHHLGKVAAEISERFRSRGACISVGDYFGRVDGHV